MQLKKFLEDLSIQNSAHRLVYQYLYHFGPLTLAKLCDLTHLNRLKIMRILDELVKHSFVQSAGFDESSGGRPPQLYQINPKSSYVVGISISRIETKIALFDLSLKILEQKQFVMKRHHTPAVVLKEIKACILKYMDEYDFDLDDLLGIGVGVVGPFDREKGMLLNPEGFLASGWHNVPLQKMIEDIFPVKTLLENYSNLAALGEFRQLDGAHQNILYCFNGWVWSCAMIVEGKLLPLEHEDTAIFGHMIIDANGRLCTCGRRGCAVMYSSLTTVLNEIRLEKPNLYQLLWSNKSEFSIDKIIDFLIKHKDVDHIVMRTADYLGLGIANLANVFQSSLVVLSGPLIDFYPGYFAKTIEVAKKNLLAHKHEVTFSTERVKGKSALVGSGTLVLDHFIGDPLI